MDNKEAGEGVNLHPAIVLSLSEIDSSTESLIKAVSFNATNSIFSMSTLAHSSAWPVRSG